MSGYGGYGSMAAWGQPQGYGGVNIFAPPPFMGPDGPAAPPITMNTASSTGTLPTQTAAINPAIASSGNVSPVLPGVTGTVGAAGAVPGAGGSAGKLGLNFDTAQLALSGLTAIGNLWAAFQSQKLAKKQFEYTKRVTDTNLSNQIQQYNDGIVDRANNRAIVEGRDAAYTKKFIDTRKLKEWGG